MSTPSGSFWEAPKSETVVTDGNWHQVVAVYHAGGVAEIFVDGGGVEDTGPAHTIVNAATAKFMVGGVTYGGTPGGIFTGMVDELQVFDHALSPCEVEYLYRNPGERLPEPGLLGLWHFNEEAGPTAADSMGGNDGTLGGDAAFVTGGVFGNAISMSKGGSGFISMGDVLPMNHCGDFSLVFWVKTTDTSTETYLLSRHYSGGTNGYFVGANVGAGGGLGAPEKVYFYTSHPAPLHKEPISTTSVTDGAWHQVAAVYRFGGNHEIFVDDGPAEHSMASYPVVYAANTHFVVGGLTIGGEPDGTYTGQIDELQVYGHALSQAEIESLYADTGELIFRDSFEEETP